MANYYSYMRISIKENNDAKSIRLYATKKGITLSQVHKTYHIKELISTNKILSKSFTLD